MKIQPKSVSFQSTMTSAVVTGIVTRVDGEDVGIGVNAEF